VGRGNRAGGQLFSLWAAHQKTAIGLVGWQEDLGVLGGGIHQNVMSLHQFGGDDGVVEVRAGGVLVQFDADVDEDREGPDAGQAKHGNQQRGLVAANTEFV